MATKEHEAREERTKKGIMDRDVKGTVRIDFRFLEQVGILDDFLALTERVGFTRRFFEIPALSRPITELTLEFFASVVYHSGSEDEDHDEPYIGFFLGGIRRTMTLARLRDLFHLPEQPILTDCSFPEDQDGHPVTTLEAVWYQLTGLSYEDPKVTAISHPSIRTTLRIISFSLFARGESSLRPLDSEVVLLYYMLSPAAQYHDLAYYMVRYWESIQRSTRHSGPIHGGAYVTLIAHTFPDLEVGVDFVPEEVLDRGAFSRFHWTRRQGRQSLWSTTQAGMFPLPLEPPRLIVYGDPTSWRIDLPVPPPQPERPAQAQGDVHMEDASALPPPAGQPFSWEQLSGTLQQILAQQQQHTQILTRLDERVTYLWDHYHRWDCSTAGPSSSAPQQFEDDQQPPEDDRQQD